MVRAVVGGFSLTELKATRRSTAWTASAVASALKATFSDVLPLPPLVVPNEHAAITDVCSADPHWPAALP